MTAPDGTSDVDALRAEIDATREQLGRTVDELSNRLDVPARARERVGGLVDDHEADRAAQPAGSRHDRGAGEPGEVQRVLDGQSHALLPAATVGPGRVRTRRLVDHPIATKRHCSVTLRRRYHRDFTLRHDASLSSRQ